MNRRSKTSKKNILITGCSSGFGLLTAARLSASGHCVIATMRDLDKRAELANELNKRGSEADLLRLDVTDGYSISQTISSIAARYGHLDVLINNAGYGVGGFFEDLSEKDTRDQFETNFFGVLNVTRQAISLMRNRENAKIINISSVAGFSASPGLGAYSASKWALEAFSESLRYELKFFGIDVLLIEPGSYKTKIFLENKREAQNFNNVESPYFPMSQHLKKKVTHFIEGCNKDPEKIAVLTEKLINSHRPAFRNFPDIESRIAYGLRRVLPFRVYSWLNERALFNDFNPASLKNERVKIAS